MQRLKLLSLLCITLLLAFGATPGCGGSSKGKNPPKQTDKRQELTRDYAKLIKGLSYKETTATLRSAIQAEEEGLYKRAVRLYQTALLLTIQQYKTRNFTALETADYLSARGEAILMKLAYLADELYDYKETARFQREVSRDLSPAFQARVQYFLSFSEWSSHELPAAKECWDSLQYITDWTVIGPFDNERGTGFNIDYGPESEIDFSASYKGKVRPVQWREFPVEPNFGTIKLDSTLRPNAEVLAYAVSYLYSDTQQLACLKWSAAESAKIWLNGEQIFNLDIERRRRFDQNSIPVQLQQGWNIVLVKLTSQEGEWAFSLRSTKLNGKPLALKTSNKAQDTRNNKTVSSKDALAGISAATSAITLFMDPKTRYQSPVDIYMASYLLNHSMSFDKNQHPDKVLIEKAIAQESSNASFYYQLAKTSFVSTKMSAEQEHNDYRVALESCVSLSGRHAEALLDLASYYHSYVGNQQKALHYVEQALGINPNFANATDMKAKILTAKGFHQEAFRLIKENYERYPKHIPAMLDRANSLQKLGQINHSTAIFESILDMDSSLNRYRRQLLNLYTSKGEIKKVLAGHMNILQYDPYAISSYQARADIFTSHDDFQNAIDEYKKALHIRPEDYQLLTGIANNYYALGEKNKALNYWERALEIYPNNTDLREYLEFLNRDKKSLADYFPENGLEIIAQSIDLKTAQEKYPNEAFVYLLNKHLSKLNDDSTVSYLEHEIIMILNERGIQQFDTHSGSTAGSNLRYIFARVIHADGSITDVKLGGGYGIDLPSLTIGDIIEIQYQSDQTEVSVFGDYFGERYIFTYTIPIESSKYVLVSPKNRKLYFHYRNMEASDPSISYNAEQDWEVRTWEFKPGKIKSEAFMPSLNEISPQIHVSSYRSWDDFAHWYWNMIRKQHEVTPEMQDKIASILQGTTTEQEKIQAIYNWVVSKITYNDSWEFGVHGYKPYNASTIFKRRRGDCKDKAILINTMLNEIGVKAYPVLIRMEQETRSEEDLSLPMTLHFNHCISVVPGKGENGSDLYLDGTATYSAMDTFPAYDQGATVVVIKENGGEVKTIPYSGVAKDLSIEHSTITVQADGNASMHSDIQANGSSSYIFRRLFQTPEIQQRQWEQLYGSKLSNARMTSTPVYSDLADLNTPVTVAFDMAFDSFSQRVDDDTLRFKANRYPLRNHLNNKPELSFSWTDLYAKKNSRSSDLILPSPWAYKTVCTVKIPEGYNIKHLPRNIQLNEEFASFAVHYQIVEGGYRVEKYLASKSIRIKVAQYSRFRNFCISMDKAEEEDIEIVKQP